MSELNGQTLGIATRQSGLLRYHIDISPLLSVVRGTLDTAGIFCTLDLAANTALYHPVHIAQFALVHWDLYVANGGDEHKETFIAQALWLLAHESRLTGDTGGWPLPLMSLMPHTYVTSQPVLSALAQGNGISVLVRAYQLTGEEAFLQAASRAVRIFELDILDGGISTPIGDTGIFFEEIAIYPASHSLRGYIFALFGLYDYMEITRDSEIEPLIQRSLIAFHMLIGEFDTGYWTYCDLLHKPFASRSDHLLHILLIEALAEYTHCDYCAAMAKRWALYQQRFVCRLHYLISSTISRYANEILRPGLRRLIGGSIAFRHQAPFERICIPITAFPVPGGMKSVLAGVVQAMGDQWQITYLTNYRGKGAEQLDIKVFGWGRGTSPWQFPSVWLYYLTGGYKLFRLLYHDSGFSLILPQDGLYSAAFATLIGKPLGDRIVCMDHGTITCLTNTAFQRERAEAVTNSSRLRRLLFYLQSAGYWPSLRLLAWLATPWIDHFLIAGDEVEEVYRKKLGVQVSCITRYSYIVDTTRFTPPTKEVKAKMRADRKIPEDAIVITLINRLAPEKGLSFALEGIALLLAGLPTATRKRVRVLIAGDGPLRSQVEADIVRYNLDPVCTMWGEANPADVVMLLGLSDIFLYSGTRGTNYSMAVLEAMAAACAVVATVSPRSNARLLAEGRGIAIMPADTREIGTALTLLCNDQALRHRMGLAARKYVATYHNTETFKRTLLRVSHFIPSLERMFLSHEDPISHFDSSRE